MHAYVYVFDSVHVYICQWINNILLRKLFYRKFIRILISVQLLSLLVTGIGVFATLFVNHTERNVSTTLSAGVYYILCATVGPYVAYQWGFVEQLKQYWWKFMIIGFLDFYSTYFRTLALSYTSVSSNQVFKLCPWIHMCILCPCAHKNDVHTHIRTRTNTYANC